MIVFGYPNFVNDKKLFFLEAKKQKLIWLLKERIYKSSS
jgi:hypothetical protein